MEQLEHYLRERRGYLQQLAGRSEMLAREFGRGIKLGSIIVPGQVHQP
ncbi:hypothetical protein SEF58_04515 [Neomoorella humiferrea]